MFVLVGLEKRQIIIKSYAMKRDGYLAITYSNIIIIIAGSIFLPYILTGIVLILLALHICIDKNTRRMIFEQEASRILFIFFAFTITQSILYRNWTGAAVGIGVMFAMVLGLFMRSVMTYELYEKALSTICVFSLTSNVYAIGEQIVLSLQKHRFSTQRISALSGHPNYFGTMVGMVVIICAYKVLSNQKRKSLFVFIALMNLIGMYLSRSMFVWAEVFIGITVLLILMRKHLLLTLWVLTAIVAGVLIFGFRIELIPRLSDIDVTVKLRLIIWKNTIMEIKSSPLVGHGFMSYMYVFKNYYLNRIIPHSHNLYLDMLLNFGLTGTIMFLWYFIKYYIAVIKLFIKDRGAKATSIILAVTSAILVHGMIDITILWIQTLPLMLLILSGLGAYEKDKKWNYGFYYEKELLSRTVLWKVKVANFNKNRI